MAKLFLLGPIQTIPDESPFTAVSQPRITSPLPGRSSLITSAPMSARILVACGPESEVSSASTRTPSSARRGVDSFVILFCISPLPPFGHLPPQGGKEKLFLDLWEDVAVWGVG